MTVRIGDLWQRANGNTYRIADERMEGSLRHVLLKPIAGSKGCVMWKWDQHVMFEMKRIGDDEAEQKQS